MEATSRTGEGGHDHTSVEIMSLHEEAILLDEIHKRYCVVEELRQGMPMSVVGSPSKQARST